MSGRAGTPTTVCPSATSWFLATSALAPTVAPAPIVRGATRTDPAPIIARAPIVVREILQLIETINRDEGLTVLIVEQNANLALQVASRAYVLEVGRVVLEGTSHELASNESMRSSYLGY